MKMPFFTLRARMMRWALRTLWLCAVPAVYLALRRKARKDQRFLPHIRERFGKGDRLKPGSVWIQVHSARDLRSSAPLIQALLARGERICVTHTDPGCRAELTEMFPTQMDAGTLNDRFQPLEQSWAYRRFFDLVRPKLGLVMETASCPIMIASAARHKLPLFLCNGQYPADRFDADGWFRRTLPTGFTGVMVKSQIMADRFDAAGCIWIAITGDLRFERPIEQDQISAAAILHKRFDQPVITLSHVPKSEEDLFISTITAIPKADRPYFIFVPAEPDRADRIIDGAVSAGLSVQKRIQVLSAEHVASASFEPGADILMADDLADMAFYLSLADHVIIGGGFTPHAAQNIIECLGFGRPIAVGPTAQCSAYPVAEALGADICTQLHSVEDLHDFCRQLASRATVNPAIATFLDEHGDAASKTLKAIDRLSNRYRANP